MTNLNKMYPGVANSPDTFLTSPLASGGNIMYVADSSVFGTLPNLAVLGSGANAETVLIISKRSDQGLNIQRAVEGVARDWAKASIVARNFTNYDYKQLKENIEKINTSKQENLTAGDNIQITNGIISATDTKYDDTQIKKDIATLQNSQLAKASKTEAESGTDNTKYMTPQTTKQAIEKLSPKEDLSGYALKTEIKTKLSEMEDDNTHRTVTDTEKEKWNNTKSTEVVDNLITDDGTKALSARQGKVLQDNKADKSDISRCKTKGYDTSSTWQTLGTTRDLEDWIGDFDGRTRELKENSNIKYTQSMVERGMTNTWTNTWAKIRIGKYMILIGTSGSDLKTLLSKLFFEEDERPKRDNYYAVATFTNSGVYGISLFSLRANGVVSQDMVQPKEYVSGSLVLAYELA